MTSAWKRPYGQGLRRLGAGAGLALLAFALPARAASPIDYVVTPETATIAFETHVAKVVPVDGTFAQFTGHVRVDPANPSAVRIEIVVDDGRIAVAFGGAATLRSAAYFDHARYPTITFDSDSVRPLPQDRFAIAGTLTIRGVSHPQVLTGVLTRITVGGVPAMHLVFHGALDRTDFGLVADRPLIADKVALTITTTLRAP